MGGGQPNDKIQSMPAPIRPTHLEINLSQLRRNLAAIRAYVHPAKVLVMLKANAYGHGLMGVAPYIAPYVDYLGVAILEEALQLREMGLQKPILIAGGSLPGQIPAYLDYDLTLTISSPLILAAAEQAAQQAGKRLKVHFKIDTGMERAGQRWYEAEALLEQSLSCSHLVIEGIYTHFANSETIETPGMILLPNYSYASQQLERFHEVLRFYEKRSLPLPPLRHAANSAAILNLPESHFDMVRPGIIFYGIYPDDEARRVIEIAPALTWKSQVVYSKITQAGSPASYGSLWASDHAVYTVTIPCGYADGYFRRMSNQPKIIVNGKKYPQVGQICMDQVIVNLEAETAEVGDEVILLGQAASGEAIQPQDLAAWAGTGRYEVLTNISARVPRVFVEK
jgi:alanine racemase